jgi:hypothetical protein
MAKSNDAHRKRRVCMNAGDLAPLVKEFTHQLSNLGYARQTARGYEWPSRHLVRWLQLSKLAVADIHDAVVERFARHRCRCPGIRCAKKHRRPLPLGQDDPADETHQGRHTEQAPILSCGGWGIYLAAQ